MQKRYFYPAIAGIILRSTQDSAENNATITSTTPAESYFRDTTASSLLYTHIALMSLAWIFALPICVALDLAGSNLWYPSQISFFGLHAIGVIFGLAYSSKTPDLYPNNSHYKFGWALTIIVLLRFAYRILRSLLCPRKNDTHHPKHERGPFIPLSTIAEEDLESSVLLGNSDEDGSRSDETDSPTLYDVGLSQGSPFVDPRYCQPTSFARRWTNVLGAVKAIQLPSHFSSTFNSLVMLLGFAALCTGIITMAGIFRGEHVFNGLAHFIKGGVFFFYGVITLMRWSGCFADRGWAWNLKGSSLSEDEERKFSLTMEGLESLLIFVYGVTNVFLEHLSAWGGAWAPQDFEHVAISLLFIGGGLCGIMVESKSLAGLTRPPKDLSPQIRQSYKETLQPGYSINPVPPMLVFVLGLILGGHHQNSMESTMMHKTFGQFLTAASAARCATYLMLYISPPTSTSPSRPPPELISSFCLISGGLMLMASNRDTVDAMINNKLNAMLIATIIMGLTVVIMAWCIFVVAVKSWAARREDVYRSEIKDK